MSKTKALYESYHECCPFPAGLSTKSTFHARKALAAYPSVRKALDFGCGNGYAVKEMRRNGHDWYGLELSEAAWRQYLQEPYFYVGSLAQFPDKSFDLVYSTEVMEHIPEDEVEEIAGHICRVARDFVFMTISLRPSAKNNRFHCTLKPREWWEAAFTGHGFTVDSDIVRAYQKVTIKTTRQILSRWARLGSACEEFARNPPYELYGETQFWYFAFYRNMPRRTRLQRALLTLRCPKLAPLMRRCLSLPVRAQAACTKGCAVALPETTTCHP